MTTTSQWKTLESHPFCAKVLRNWAQVLLHYLPTEKDLEHLLKYGKPGERSIPPHDFYFIRVGNRLLNVFDALWKIDASTVFLRQYPYKRTLAKFQITRDRYMKYHLESYYVSVASCVDRVALLVNDIFDLGLPARLAKVPMMDQLKNSKAGKALKNMYDSLMKERHLKNLITHEAEIEDMDLIPFALLSSLLLDENTLNSKGLSSVARERLARSSLHVYLRKKGMEMDRINHRLQQKLSCLLDQLQRDPHYKEPLSDELRQMFLAKE
jgi:hypothetical protein